MRQFALIGVGGYIAPRHLRAIKDTGNILVAALDRSDSVGVLDSYFPDCRFFTEFERFDRHLEKLKRNKDTRIDYLSVCSPNYLHDSHCRFGLRIGADVICEKPLVINPWNVDALAEIEQETGGKINTILQLRLHAAIQALKKEVDAAPPDKYFEIELTYITSRGPWYDVSWKGDIHKSGGIPNNIGIHFFDMLTWIFGPIKQNIVHLFELKKAAGFLELERGRVRWFLSLDRNDLPFEPEPNRPKTYRSITVDGREIDFSEGFTELHTTSYEQILAGNGFRLDEVKPAIEIVSDIRNIKPIAPKGNYHPMLAK